RTVTCLRSPSRAALEVRMRSARRFGVYASGEANRDTAASGVGSAPNAAPQLSQNLLPAATFAPQLAQSAANVAPHSRQKRAPSRLSAWHREHFMPEPPGTRAGTSRNGNPRVMPPVLDDQGRLRRVTARPGDPSSVKDAGGVAPGATSWGQPAK